MLILFEVMISAGCDPDSLFSVEVLEETKAQVMTVQEAQALGFSASLVSQDAEVRLIAVTSRDAGFIQHRLEISPVVQQFTSHEIATG